MSVLLQLKGPGGSTVLARSVRGEPPVLPLQVRVPAQVPDRSQTRQIRHAGLGARSADDASDNGSSFEAMGHIFPSIF